MKRTVLYAICLHLLLTTFSHAAFALDPIYVGGSDRAAIKGYDTVAYFTEGKAVAGKKEYTHEYMGATWYFASKEHLEKFIAAPEKYAPQYGGYCAYAISRNTTASIKPEVFNIYEGKLYLNYNAGVQKKWLKNKEERIETADQHWPELLKR
jgi:YHS domain-containing protein